MRQQFFLINNLDTHKNYTIFHIQLIFITLTYLEDTTLTEVSTMREQPNIYSQYLSHSLSFMSTHRYQIFANGQKKRKRHFF